MSKCSSHRCVFFFFWNPILLRLFRSPQEYIDKKLENIMFQGSQDIYFYVLFWLIFMANIFNTSTAKSLLSIFKWEVSTVSRFYFELQLSIQSLYTRHTKQHQCKYTDPFIFGSFNIANKNGIWSFHFFISIFSLRLQAHSQLIILHTFQRYTLQSVNFS